MTAATTQLPQFSAAQWDFLAALAVFSEPASMDILGALVALPPGPLFELVRRAEALNWVAQDGQGCFRLQSDLPQELAAKLAAINTPERLKQTVDGLKSAGLFLNLSKTARADLLARVDRPAEALRLKMEVALERSRFGKAADFFVSLEEIHLLLGAGRAGAIAEPWFTSTCLELSQICISFGAGIPSAIKLLEAGLAAARSLGDQRSWALINLHLGQLYYLSYERAKAMAALEAGKSKVEELGDSDILEQAAEFIGLYYAIQGLIRQAVPYLEKALKPDARAEKVYIKPLAPVLLAYGEAYLGQFHRAIGCLDCHWHIARRSDKPAVAATLRAALGTVLLLIENKKEALHHLNAARKEAESGGYPFAGYLALGGLAYYHFLEGDLAKSYDLFVANLHYAARAGTVGQFSSPWVLEIIAGFDQCGFAQVPGWSFDDYYRRALEDPNIHLRGVARRLRAAAMARSGGNRKAVLKELLRSEENLKRAGDPVQLAKTHLELAQLNLRQGQMEEARILAEQARQGLAGCWEDLFPDGLRALLDERAAGNAAHHTGERPGAPPILDRFLELIEDVVPKPNPDDNLDQLVSALNRFFMAERGALFWCEQRRGGTLVLRAGRNILSGNLATDPMRLISRCFKESKPLVLRSSCGEFRDGALQPLSILCLPVEFGGRPQGVLYFDNSYMHRCFDCIDEAVLAQLARYLNSTIEKICTYGRLIEEAGQTKLVSLSGDACDEELLFESSAMMRIISKAARVAQTSASVLLLGETGVGKEAVARWIHKNSHRPDAPFIVVDPTTVPENLFESELFGHEKGAFTGAYRRKSGRLELAHGGTLFIDEIGDISLQVQTKLLRVLQEKTLTRVGGTQSIATDFRLLSATNRTLGAEIAGGRFREDLYYRINVLELSIPPLRERPEDIVLLARHFIEKYARRYNRAALSLSKAEQKKLSAYHWPGNVRELQNVIERSILLSTGATLELNLPAPARYDQANPFADLPSMEEMQRRYIAYVLERTNGRISGRRGAAELLGMKRTTLHSRMARLGFTSPTCLRGPGCTDQKAGYTEGLVLNGHTTP